MPIDDSFTKSLLHFDGVNASTTFRDESGKIWTAGGNAQIDTAQKKFGSSSLLLDGDSDYITTPDSDDWSFGSDNFTIDFDVRFSSLTNDQRFCGQYASTSNRWYLRKLANASGNKLELFFKVGGVSKAEYTMTNSWSGCAINTQYHLAFVRSGTSIKIFIDGVSQTLTETVAIGTNDVGNVSAVLNIGQEGAAAAYLSGWLDEFRISKGIARWTTDFTSPTIPYLPVVTVDQGSKPVLINVNPTTALFTSTSTTYSDPTVQYSSSTQVYGGVDQKNEIPPSVKSVDDVRPSFERVGNAS